MPKQKKKTDNGYKMPDPIAVGEILTDLSKKQWKIGPSIGKGGFGEIYSAQEATSTAKDYNYVVKIEPHSNGPLFVEMHFYMKFGKPALVEDFRKKRNLETFGMPVYHGHGSHEYKNEKYRFLVLDRLGKDLQKVYEENNKCLPIGSVFKLAVQILYVLEYIHNNDYVHADIKAANILFGTTKDTCNQAYLVDFGLASKYTTEKQFKPNPKKAHDGTIEYLSRDAHKGVQTRRGDLEVLAYNLIQWLGCKLPWEKDLADPNAVHASKTKYMDDISQFMKTCFGSSKPPNALVKFLEYIITLPHDAAPNYEKIKKMFIDEIEAAGDSLNEPFEFKTSRKSLKRKSASRLSFSIKKAKVGNSKLKVKNKPVAQQKSQETKEEKRPVKLKNKVQINKEEHNDDIYNGFTPEMRALMEKKLSKAKVKNKKSKTVKTTVQNQTSENGLQNDTKNFNSEMKEIHQKIMEQNVTKRKNQVSSLGGESTSDRPRRNLNPISYSEKTPAALRKLLNK